MPDDNPPYYATIEVTDCQGETLAKHTIIFDHTDNAMQTYGTAVDSVNRLQAKKRRERNAAEKAATPKE